MTQQASVVTPQRFDQGVSYETYMGQIKVNKARFEDFYNNFSVTAEDTAALKELVGKANGPAKMLVLGEDWCGDVIRGLPVLARIAEASGMQMTVFPRDENHDIMNEFLKNGQWMSIPVAVFYTKDHEYISHWIERPEIAEQEMEQIEKDIRAETPDISDQDFGRERRARTASRSRYWQDMTVTEIRDLLTRLTA
jgi:thiol-disulfide isomerase/thioredoxin